MIGFKPVFNYDSKILILGSFPSVVSRNMQFYYGNPRNRFWKLLCESFNVELNTVNEKIDFLLSNNIAIWDIVMACEINGSLDVNITNPTFADIKSVLPPHSKINKILCNGKKSYELTIKYLKQNNLNFETICLPSTSPANCNFNKNLWISELNKIKK